MNTVLICNHRRNISRFIGFLYLVAGSILLSSTIHAQPVPRMGISPDRYQITFDERGGETQSLMVQNLSDEPLTIKLSVNNWELDDNNQIEIIPPTESSLDQWIVINPLRVTIPPGAPQTIRWAVMPRLRPESGEYRAIIYVEEELPPQQVTANSKLRMNMRFGLPVYAHVGEKVESATVHGISVSKGGKQVNLEVSNEGNTHARISGNYGVWPSADFPGSEKAIALLDSLTPDSVVDSGIVVGSLPGSVVLPGSRRIVPFLPALKSAGEYTLQFNGGIAQVLLTDFIQLTD